MVEIRERTSGNGKYLYLEHTFRINGKILKRELYLGKKLPNNIEALKRKFLEEIYSEKWYKQLDKIKAAYKIDQKSSPESAKEKEVEGFMIRFTYDSQRIEGSTLTLRETADLLQHGISPSNKPNRDVKEAEAHALLFYEIISTKKELTMQLLLEWHYNLLKGTKPDIAGKIREKQVWIYGSKFIPPPPVEIGVLIKEFFRWYGKNKN